MSCLVWTLNTWMSAFFHSRNFLLFLAGYYYRDDVLKLWAAIQDYVTEILAIYYGEDDDVANDDELAAMLTDLKTHGYHSKVGRPHHIESWPLSSAIIGLNPAPFFPRLNYPTNLWTWKSWSTSAPLWSSGEKSTWFCSWVFWPEISLQTCLCGQSDALVSMLLLAMECWISMATASMLLHVWWNPTQPTRGPLDGRRRRWRTCCLLQRWSRGSLAWCSSCLVDTKIQRQVNLINFHLKTEYSFL